MGGNEVLPVRRERMITFGNIGWVLVMSAVVTLVVGGMVLWPAIQRHRARPPGDGLDPATYGFDLAGALVPADEIVAAELHRDLMPPLVDPPVMAGLAIEAYNGEMRGKYVVPLDRVIGVEIAGEARAYPLLQLQLHQVVNDTLGGRTIAVTYDPLCGSAVVFDRAAGGGEAGEEILEFGVSGLLHDSNVLLYDRRDVPGTESLWSQLQARAVSGPAAGRRLTTLPAQLLHWETWLLRHPDTTVLEPDVALLPRYKGTKFARYEESEPLLFPASPAPPDGDLDLKTPCVIVDAGGARRVYPFPLIVRNADGDGRWRTSQDGVELTFQTALDPAVVTVTTGDEPAHAIYAFWFAWYAADPSCVLAGDGAGDTG